MTKTMADTHAYLPVSDTVLCALDILTDSAKQAYKGWETEADRGDSSSVKKLVSGKVGIWTQVYLIQSKYSSLSYCTLTVEQVPPSKCVFLDK